MVDRALRMVARFYPDERQTIFSIHSKTQEITHYHKK